MTCSGLATFVIYEKSAKRRCGRGITTDQNDKQRDRSDGPEHEILVLFSMRSLVYRLSDFTSFNRQPMFQSQVRDAFAFHLPFSGGCYLCSAQILITKVIHSWVI